MVSPASRRPGTALPRTLLSDLRPNRSPRHAPLARASPCPDPASGRKPSRPRHRGRRVRVPSGNQAAVSTGPFNGRSRPARRSGHRMPLGPWIRPGQGAIRDDLDTAGGAEAFGATWDTTHRHCHQWGCAAVMIDIPDLNRRLVEQDEQLQATLAAHVARVNIRRFEPSPNWSPRESVHSTNARAIRSSRCCRGLRDGRTRSSAAQAFHSLLGSSGQSSTLIVGQLTRWRRT